MEFNNSYTAFEEDGIMQFNDPRTAFEEAIQQGRLSRNEEDTHYAGNYMYMFHTEGKAQFKHLITRRYLP